jgi:tetratricopeptide (TPR) repeat protein
MKKILVISLALLIGSAASTPGFAAGSGGGGSSGLAPFQNLIDAGKYEAAIGQLQAALRKAPKNADLLNLLGYSQRKLRRFDEAMVNYRKALEVEPEHRGANEYLGELYLQLGQPQQAQERLEVLDGACFFGCEEYDDLEKAIEAYRSKNQT